MTTTTRTNPRVRAVLAHPLAQLVIGLIIVIAATAVAQHVYTRLPVPRDSPLALPKVALAAAIVITGYWLFRRFIERTPMVELAAKATIPGLLGGALAGSGLFALALALVEPLGAYQVVEIRPATVLFSAIASAAMAAIVEELLIRGLIFRLVERWRGSGVALAVSALLFGGLHLTNPGATIFAALAIAIEAGILLAAIYMATRSLWPAIGLHAGWNFAQGGLFGIPVSGQVEKGLLIGRLTGPEWLTGGAFGLENSVPAVVVCAALGASMLAVAVRRGEFRRA